MEEAHEMVMIPAEEEHTTIPITRREEERRGPGRPRKKDPDEFSKLARAINIAFKLYATGEIGEQLELLGLGGIPIPNADLIGLINYALTRGRARVGEETFVKALANAKIPLEWISNEDIRVKVASALRTPRTKRKRDEEEDDGRIAKRQRVIINEERDSVSTEDDDKIEEHNEPEVNTHPAVERPPLKKRLRKRYSPYNTRKPAWEVVDDE